MLYKKLKVKKKHSYLQEKSNDVWFKNMNLSDRLCILAELYGNFPIPFTLIKVICDADAKPLDRQFVYMNKAAAELEQCDVKDLIGKTFSELFPTTAHKHLSEYAEVAFSGATKVIAGYSPKLQKYLSIQCYQPELGYCACILTDVSEEQKAKNQLQVILENMVGALSIYDPDLFPNGLVYLSSSWQKVTGYTVEEQKRCLADNEEQIFTEETRSDIYRQMKKAFETQQKLDVIFKVQHKNGTKLWLRYSAQPVNNDGKTLYYGFVVDITSEYTARLEEEEKYNRALTYRRGVENLGYISTLVVNLTADTIVEQSRSFISEGTLLNGVRYTDLLSIIFPASENIQLKERFSRNALLAAFENGENDLEFTYQNVHFTGKRSWVKTIVKMAKSPKTGELIAFFHTYDIHKQKILGDMVMSAANKLFDMIVYIDSMSQEFVCYLHGQTQSLTLYDFDYYVAQSIENLQSEYPDFDAEQLTEKLKLNYVCKELKKQDEYCYIVNLTPKSETVLCKKITFAYMDQSIGTILMVITDVTDIYQYEKEQKELLHHALASAKQANAAKSAFLSNMSHDIRTPLNGILGMTELALLDLENKNHIKESLAIIHSSSLHLLDLVNDILEMSKIEHNAITILNEEFSLLSVINDINKMMAPLFEKKSQSYLSQCNVIHDCVIGDPLRLKRVLINLLNNASKFTQSGGQIKLTVAEQSVQTGRFVNIQFTVWDNGIGIPKDQQDTIFDAFTRVNSTNLSQVEGTGLGLAIVKSIVESSGGVIRVDSTEGVGSSFVVEQTYKIFEEKMAAPNYKQPVPNTDVKNMRFDGIHILLVEDHYVNIAVAYQMLVKLGATVTTATDGEQGYQLFLHSQKGTFDIILMDIQLPKLNGYQATQQIRQSSHPQAKTIPIVAMSANVYADEVDHALKNGMNGYISKPISTRVLAKTLNDQISNNKGDCNNG